jgi:hypothetical protein
MENSEGGKCHLKEEHYCGSLARCFGTSDDFLVEFEAIESQVHHSSEANTILMQSNDITAQINSGNNVEDVTAAFCDAVMNLKGIKHISHDGFIILNE